MVVPVGQRTSHEVGCCDRLGAAVPVAASREVSDAPARRWSPTGAGVVVAVALGDGLGVVGAGTDGEGVGVDGAGLGSAGALDEGAADAVAVGVAGSVGSANALAAGAPASVAATSRVPARRSSAPRVVVVTVMCASPSGS